MLANTWSGQSFTKSSSSSCCAANMDLPDPLLLPFSIIHHSWWVFKATSCIGTELLYMGSSSLSCLCSCMWRGPNILIILVSGGTLAVLTAFWRIMTDLKKSNQFWSDTHIKILFVDFSDMITLFFCVLYTDILRNVSVQKHLTIISKGFTIYFTLPCR